MNSIKTLIGVKLRISKDAEIPLFKGKNIIYYKDIFTNSLSNEDNKILFSLTCSSNSNIMLRTFSKYPLILKTNNTSTRYMNDSLISLNDIISLKIFPLLEQKTDCIFFEKYEIPKNLKRPQSLEMKEKETNDFLDNLIEYFEKDNNKSSIFSDKKPQFGPIDTDNRFPVIKDKINNETTENNEKITENISDIIPNDNIKTEIQKEKEISKNQHEVNTNSDDVVNKKEPPKKKRVRHKNNSIYDLEKAPNDNKENKSEDEVNTNARTTLRTSERYSFRKKIIKKERDYDDLVPSAKESSKHKYKNDTFIKKRNRTRTLSDINSYSPLKPTLQKCSICLELMKEPSQLNTCLHEFCKDCIDHWTQLSSQCPLCKENFTKVIYYDARSHNTTEKKIKKKHFKPDEEEIEQWYTNCDDKCLICGECNNTQELLICDKCNFRICHTYCVGLDVIPDGDWICPECIRKGKKKKKARNNKQLPKFNIQLRDRVPKRHTKYSLRLQKSKNC